MLDEHSHADFEVTPNEYTPPQSTIALTHHVVMISELIIRCYASAVTYFGWCNQIMGSTLVTLYDEIRKLKATERNNERNNPINIQYESILVDEIFSHS